MHGVNRKRAKLDNKLWDMDIAQFVRWHEHFHNVSNIKSKTFCVNRMQIIKDRYPHHMKNMNIPSL